MKALNSYKLLLAAGGVLFSALMPVSVFAAQDALLKVNDIKVTRVADELVVALDINPRDVNPGRDKEVTFTPVVRSADGADSLELPSVKIAGRNRYYSHLRNKDLADGAKVYYSGDRQDIEYRAEVPFLPWMECCQIDMRQDLANCCDSPEAGPETPLARLDYIRPPFVPAFNFVELTGDSAIELSAEGRAFITFVVNRTELKENYMNNPEELDKIYKTIKVVQDDPDATITYVSIKGFASPEGPYSNNVRLAMGRTETLKEVVRKRMALDAEIMHTDYEPEDWQGLIDWLKANEIEHRDEIMAIASSKMEPDPRNEEIRRRYPEQYDYILKNVYPWLRHSDYKVKYRIKAYATVEELMEVYKVSPERMRPVDFQRIAATCPTGSEQYKEIMLKAVEIHPYDSKSNLNAATIALQAGDLDKAGQYLDRAGDSAEAVYTRGVLAGMAGDLERAMQYFDKAADMGLETAAAQKYNLDSIINRNTIEYLIGPSKNKE